MSAQPSAPSAANGASGVAPAGGACAGSDSLLGTLLEQGEPAGSSGWSEHPPRKGFFTDTSLCIGCKACEVACKEWNEVPEDGLNWTAFAG